MSSGRKARYGGGRWTKARVNRALAKLARPIGEFNAERYFRGNHGLRFYNVGTGAMRGFARSIYLEHRDRWSIDDAMTLADGLIADPHLETKSVGIELVARYRPTFTPTLLPRWKRWLSRNDSANWATTDAICGMLIGPLLVRHPELAPKMGRWARDRNMWVRRASIVGLIPLIRSQRALELAYGIAEVLHPDEHDLIHKAVGWTLREAGKVDPARLERYLRAHGPAIPRTTVRYAIERFSPAKRRALLAATKQQP